MDVILLSLVVYLAISLINRGITYLGLIVAPVLLYLRDMGLGVALAALSGQRGHDLWLVGMSAGALGGIISALLSIIMSKVE